MHPCCIVTVYSLFRLPPVPLPENVRDREYFPGWDPLSSVTCITTLRHTRHCVLSCIVLCYLVCFIFIVSPPSLTDRPPRPPPPTLLCTATSSTTRSFQPSFQASIPPSLITQISPIFYLLLALE